MAPVAASPPQRISPPWQVKKASAANDVANDMYGVITVAQLLARRPRAMQMSMPQLDGPRVRAWSGCSRPRLAVAAPPGLEPPQDAQDQEQWFPDIGLPETAHEEFQVLLQNLPMAMAQEPILHVMLEQARLMDGIVGVSARQDGEAVVTFSSFEWAAQCVHHYSGLAWGKNTVTASFVRTSEKAAIMEKPLSPDASEFIPTMSAHAPEFVPSMCADALEFTPSLSADACEFLWSTSADASEFVPLMSAEAPEFVPSMFADATELVPSMSADAPVFLPSAAAHMLAYFVGEDSCIRERWCSDASTEAVPDSDNSSQGWESDADDLVCVGGAPIPVLA